MTFRLKEKTRDDRDYDTTSLSEVHGRRGMGRDYSAHFFRWSFARRLIKKTDHVLEVGCGIEAPLSKLLVVGLEPKCASYTGVDMNKLKETTIKRISFRGEFNFNERWKELAPPPQVGGRKKQGFDVAVHLEVIEHMKVSHGRKMLEGIWNLLRPGGTMLMSTPVYDGRRHAANHIHEYTVPELQKEVERAGFEVQQRFGTFMDIKEIRKQKPSTHFPARENGQADLFNAPTQAHLEEAVPLLEQVLSTYYDRDAISCIFAPLFPDHARNNLWVCEKVS